MEEGGWRRWKEGDGDARWVRRYKEGEGDERSAKEKEGRRRVDEMEEGKKEDGGEWRRGVDEMEEAV
jgi:hypothetical protein